MGVGGVDAEDNRDADCRYVIARRRSPPETVINASTTEAVTGTRSHSAMCCRRAADEELSRGLKRNLEHREASGSMILRDCQNTRPRDTVESPSPGHIIAHQTEPCNASICLHNPS